MSNLIRTIKYEFWRMLGYCDHGPTIYDSYCDRCGIAVEEDE